MKKYKMFIDIVMLILLILLYNLNITGVLLHEVLGILIWILFIIHLFLNFKWIKSITKNILNNKIKKNIKNLYIIDLLLFISFLVITISGVLISKYIFNFSIYNDLIFKIHKVSSYIAVVLILLHIIMHTEFFIKQFTKILNQKDNKKGIVLTILLVILSTILLTNNILINKLKNKKNESSDEISSLENNNNNNSDSNSYVEIDKPTLTSYLSKLFCTGCHKHCPLSNPQCGIGEKQAATETINYNELYNN